MNTTDQRICLWLVPAFAALLALAFWMFPGFFPPMSPAMTAEEVAQFYREHVGEIRVSMVIVKDRKSTRLNSSHIQKSRMPSSA